MKWAIGLVALMGIGSVFSQSAPTDSRQAEPPQPDTVALRERADRQLVRDAERVMRSRLKDPESARFESLIVARFSGAPVVCGHVNAKNGFGGYTGPKAFMLVNGAAISEDDIASSAFAKAWNKSCTE